MWFVCEKKPTAQRNHCERNSIALRWSFKSLRRAKPPSLYNRLMKDERSIGPSRAWSAACLTFFAWIRRNLAISRVDVISVSQSNPHIGLWCIHKARSLARAHSQRALIVWFDGSATRWWSFVVFMDWQNVLYNHPYHPLSVVWWLWWSGGIVPNVFR